MIYLVRNEFHTTDYVRNSWTAVVKQTGHCKWTVSWIYNPFIEVLKIGVAGEERGIFPLFSYVPVHKMRPTASASQSNRFMFRARCRRANRRCVGGATQRQDCSHTLRRTNEVSVWFQMCLKLGVQDIGRQDWKQKCWKYYTQKQFKLYVDRPSKEGV